MPLKSWPKLPVSTSRVSDYTIATDLVDKTGRYLANDEREAVAFATNILPELVTWIEKDAVRFPDPGNGCNVCWMEHDRPHFILRDALLAKVREAGYVAPNAEKENDNGNTNKKPA